MADAEEAQQYRLAQARALKRVYRAAHEHECPSVEAPTAWVQEGGIPKPVKPQPEDYEE